LFADVRELGRTIAAEGWITATDKGQAVSPVARLLRDSRRDFVTLAAKFGLTAADEARLPAAEGDDGQAADPLQTFIDGG
jgi:phage terminase small subunit